MPSHEVVDDRQREQEDAQARGATRCDERQHAEGERGVGRHRRAPPVRRRTAGVEGQVDRDGGGHAAQRGEDR
jgi:hypothetical protein